MTSVMFGIDCSRDATHHAGVLRLFRVTLRITLGYYAPSGLNDFLFRVTLRITLE